MKLVHQRIYGKVNESFTDSQIGARKNKSVINHLFILNSIISDVMSSKKKCPIDLNIMDFKQMFDSEELEICMNSLYDANITDDIFARFLKQTKTLHFQLRHQTEQQTVKILNMKSYKGMYLVP